MNELNLNSAFRSFNNINEDKNKYLQVTKNSIKNTNQAYKASSQEEINKFVETNILKNNSKSEVNLKLLTEVDKYYDRLVKQSKTSHDTVNTLWNRALGIVSSSTQSKIEKTNAEYNKLVHIQKALQSEIHSLSHQILFAKSIETPKNLMGRLKPQEDQRLTTNREETLKLNKTLVQLNKEKSVRSHLFVPLSTPKQVFNVALKDASKTAEIEVLDFIYQGIEAIQAKIRTSYAIQLLNQVSIDHNFSSGIQSQKDIEGLSRICQNRLNFYHYALQMMKIREGSSTLDKLVEEIQQNVDLLKDKSSKKVIPLNENSSSFVLPGGYEKHYISYEIRREGDNYYFVLHNKGEGVGDKNLHGNLSFNDSTTGKTYSRTTVKIKTTPEALKDPKFLKDLFNLRVDPNQTSINPVYEVIKNHFIKNGKGAIEKSPVEDELQKLSQQLEKAKPNEKEAIHKKALHLMQQDSATFGALQLYGTCGESNFVTTETEMASPLVCEAIQSFTTATLVDKLKGQIIKGKYHGEINIHSLVKHSEQQLGLLKEKMAQDKEMVALDAPQREDLYALFSKPKKIPLTPAEKADIIKGIENSEYQFSILPKLFRADKDIVLVAINKNGADIRFVPKELREDYDVILASIKQNPLALKFIPTTAPCFNDRSKCLELVKQNGVLLQYMPKFNNDAEIIKLALKQNPAAIRFVSKEFQDKDLILETLKKDGLLIQYLNPKFRLDNIFITTAFGNNVDSLSSLPENFNDRKLAIDLLKQNPQVYAYLPKHFRKDVEIAKIFLQHDDKLWDGKIFQRNAEYFSDHEELMLLAIKKPGNQFQYASTRLKRNINVVKAAVEKEPIYFIYAAPELRKLPDFISKEIAIKILKDSPDFIEYMSDNLKKDRDLVLMAVKGRGKNLQFADSTLQEDQEIVKEAIIQDFGVIRFAKIKSALDQDPDIKIMQKFIKNEPFSFKDVSENLKKNKNFVAAVVDRDGWLLQYADPSLRNDPDIAQKAIESKYIATRFVSKELRSNLGFMKPLLKHFNILEYAEPNLKNNFEAVMAAVQRNGRAIQFASAELRDNEELAKAALKESINSYEFLSDRLKALPHIQKLAGSV